MGAFNRKQIFILQRNRSNYKIYWRGAIYDGFCKRIPSSYRGMAGMEYRKEIYGRESENKHTPTHEGRGSNTIIKIKIQALVNFNFMKTSEINFKVTLDENNLPLKIDWEAASMNEKSSCKSVLISLWDAKENNTLKIDLWTKDMMVDEMKIFFHQTLLSMADTLIRSTGEEKMAEDLKDYCAHFAEKMNLLKKG